MLKTKGVIMSSGVYCITDLENGKKYVGSSIDIKARWRSHRAKSKKVKDQLIRRVISEKGIENFRFETLLVLPALPALMHQAEKFYTELYQSNDPAHGYNIGLVAAHSASTKQKMAELKLGNKNAVGWVPSEETRKKISESKRGSVRSEEAKRKTSESLKETWRRRKNEN